MRTLQSEIKRLKLDKYVQKKNKKRKSNKKRRKKEEKLNFVELMGMNKRGYVRGKGGAWRQK